MGIVIKNYILCAYYIKKEDIVINRKNGWKRCLLWYGIRSRTGKSFA
jgi:hypothetical protein